VSIAIFTAVQDHQITYPNVFSLELHLGKEGILHWSCRWMRIVDSCSRSLGLKPEVQQCCVPGLRIWASRFLWRPLAAVIPLETFISN
jgi:hypothetical protein